jgi:DNA-directed RNA polymerase
MKYEDLNAIEWLKIDIANCAGYDKLTWCERIVQGSRILDMIDELPLEGLAEFINSTPNPKLLRKALIAYGEILTTKRSGHNMFMDSTASGLQIMACLSNCRNTGLATNLVDPSKRYDPYTMVTDEMMKRLPHSKLFEGLSASEVRKLVKQPIMTNYYNSLANPKAVFGEGTEELEVFYEVLNDLFPGAEDVMKTINESWDPTKLVNEWVMPDGHLVRIKVMETIDTRIEVDELDLVMNYRFKANKPSKNYRSLAANVIHSIDAWICRELVRRCDFEIAPIHDAFSCSPVNMTKLMDTYRDILIEIAESDMLADILTQIEGKDVHLDKYEYDLASDISNAQYFLS